MVIRKGGTVILDIPALEIREGEILALIGPNGAGKSTLLLALSGIEPSTAGEVLFRGGSIRGDANLAYRRRITMVFQEPLLFRGTVFDNVATGLRFRGCPRREIDRRVTANLERFRIAPLADRKARTLSGGEAQRTSLARAFAVEPELLLLDEPFAALDPPTRESIIADLEAVLRHAETTTVMATHDRIEAIQLADRLAVMGGGRILQAGPPEEVMNRPVDETVAEFVGVETIITGTVTRCLDGGVVAEMHDREIEAVGSAQVGETVLLGIRPEHVTLSRGPRSRTSARNLLAGTVTGIHRRGFYARVDLDCGFPLVAYVTVLSLEELDLAVGTTVDAVCKATAVHVIGRRR
jgi:tungstate transport system ATP-binding protein